jgi:hypothetical protein
MTKDNYSLLIADLKEPSEGMAPKDNSMSRKIFSFIVQNKHKIRDMHDYTRIVGSLQFNEGLEYHYNNFTTHLQNLAAKECLFDDSMLDHEAVAYINRLGQAYYFARSFNMLKHCPKIKELYLFRRKNTGHRSIDCPIEKEDNTKEQIWQSSCLRRKLFSGKLDENFTVEDLQEYKNDFLSPKRYTNKKVLVSYQILSGKRHADFTPQSDHPVILKEIEDVYVNLFSSR